METPREVSDPKPKTTVSGNPPADQHWDGPAPQPIDPKTGHCGRCGQTKPAGAFHKNSRRSSGLHGTCKECRTTFDRKSHAGDAAYLARVRSWRARNRERVRDYALKSDFGLPLGGFAVMHADQGGLCAICQKQPTESLQLDHDHALGTIRSLLCGSCNRGLGHFFDSPELLEAAAAYVRRFRSVPRLAIPSRVGR